MRTISVALLGAAVLVASAAAAGPTVRLTAAGNTSALASLLSAKTLGKGWTGTTPVRGGFDPTCNGFDPSEKGIVERGDAELPSLALGNGDPIISQQTSVYANADQAGTLWKRAVTPALVSCVRESLEALGAKGIKVKVLSQGPLAVKTVGTMTAGYRIIADLSSKYTRKIYFDLVLVGRGDTISAITISSFVDPVPADFEYALAKIVYDQIGASTG